MYSVPAFGSEEYAREMYLPDAHRGAFQHHEKTSGPADQFGYKDFNLLMLAACCHNRYRDWGVEGANNSKNEVMPPFAGVHDVARGQLAGIRPLFWQTDTSVAYNSRSFTHAMRYHTPASAIQCFLCCGDRPRREIHGLPTTSLSHFCEACGSAG